MYFDKIKKKMTQTTKTFYTIINLLSLATKDYLVPKKKLSGIRKTYLILNESILNYKYILIKLEELNDTVKREDVITAYVYEN